MKRRALLDGRLFKTSRSPAKLRQAEVGWGSRPVFCGGVVFDRQTGFFSRP